MLIKLGVQGTNVSDITVGRNGAGVISLSRLKDDRMGASEGVNSAHGLRMPSTWLQIKFCDLGLNSMRPMRLPPCI